MLVNAEVVIHERFSRHVELTGEAVQSECRELSTLAWKPAFQMAPGVSRWDEKASPQRSTSMVCNPSRGRMSPRSEGD